MVTMMMERLGEELRAAMLEGCSGGASGRLRLQGEGCREVCEKRSSTWGEETLKV